ncbi:MAG: DUF1538 domain-containing protein [Gammaproteobacteria bacterium]|nr:DUF1538 domain-containing protein [Gammaproteobacteria bacterium]
MDLITESLAIIGGTALDVLPIAAFLFLFQWLVIGGRMPDRNRILAGFVLVVVGLGCFLVGLEEALFPLGRMMAEQLTDPALIGTAGAAVGEIRWSDYYWVYAFAFSIGFSTALAEPAVLAVALKARDVSGGAIHPWGLRVAVAIGVAVGVTLGCFRIVTGTPLPYYIMAGYAVVIVQTWFAPRLIVPLAYDSGGVTTSTVTVPLVAALGLGLAESVPGRSPLLDGFGLVAFAALFPIMSVLGYAQLSQWLGQRRAADGDGEHPPPDASKEDKDHAL